MFKSMISIFLYWSFAGVAPVPHQENRFFRADPLAVASAVDQGQAEQFIDCLADTAGGSILETTLEFGTNFVTFSKEIKGADARTGLLLQHYVSGRENMRRTFLFGYTAADLYNPEKESLIRNALDYFVKIFDETKKWQVETQKAVNPTMPVLVLKGECPTTTLRLRKKNSDVLTVFDQLFSALKDQNQTKFCFAGTMNDSYLEAMNTALQARPPYTVELMDCFEIEKMTFAQMVKLFSRLPYLGKKIENTALIEKIDWGMVPQTLVWPKNFNKKAKGLVVNALAEIREKNKDKTEGSGEANAWLAHINAIEIVNDRSEMKKGNGDDIYDHCDAVPPPTTQETAHNQQSPRSSVLKTVGGWLWYGFGLDWLFSGWYADEKLSTKPGSPSILLSIQAPETESLSTDSGVTNVTVAESDVALAKVLQGFRDNADYLVLETLSRSIKDLINKPEVTSFDFSGQKFPPFVLAAIDNAFRARTTFTKAVDLSNTGVTPDDVKKLFFFPVLDSNSGNEFTRSHVPSTKKKKEKVKKKAELNLERFPQTLNLSGNNFSKQDKAQLEAAIEYARQQMFKEHKKSAVDSDDEDAKEWEGHVRNIRVVW